MSTNNTMMIVIQVARVTVAGNGYIWRGKLEVSFLFWSIEDVLWCSNDVVVTLESCRLVCDVISDVDT